MNSTGVGCAILTMAVMTAELASANTVAWWRFEDSDAGSPATTLVNAVDSANLPGTATVLSGQGLPLFADGFESAVLWNPSASQASANARSLRFADSNGNAGRVEIASDETLHPKTFTIEFFFKYEATGELPNWKPLVGMMNNSNKEAFYLRLHKTSGTDPKPSISVRFHNADGTSRSSDFAQADLADGKWHHVAMCVYQEGENWKARCFADYQSIGLCTLSEPVHYVDGYPLLIGGNFPGLIDEVRLSDTVLDPKDFLRLHEVSPIADTSTAVYLDFSTRPAVNKAPSESPFSVSDELNAKSATALTDETPGSVVRADSWTKTSLANATALTIATSDACPTSPGRLTYDDTANRLSTGSFTAELFFRVDDFGDATSSSTGDCIYLFCSPTWFLRIMRADHSLSSYFKIGGKDVSLPLNTKLEAGEWHHVAIVYNKEAQTLAVYLDYQRKNSQSNVTLDIRESSYPTAIAGGMWSGGQYQFTRGAIDEVRITRRALKPAEFLSVVPSEGGKLIHLTYETDTTTSSVNGKLLGGSWINNTENPPTLSDRVPGDSLRDARGQVVRDTNTHALSYDNRYIAYDSASILDRRDLTVEFFMRASETKASAGVMRLVDNLNVNDFVWGLRTDATGRTMEVVASTESEPNKVVATYPADSFDGRWHHYALSFRTEADHSVVALYRDYEKTCEQALGGLLDVASGTSRFYVGGGSTAWIDEIVVHDGARGPESFLYLPKKGFVVVIR